MSAPARQRIDGIDFWRGFALLTIFVDHAPANLVAHFTHGNFGFSDGAELFVFLSGLSVALAYGRGFMAGRVMQSIQGTFRRAATLYWVQIAVSLAGIAFLAAAAYVLDSDDLTDDPDRDIVMDSPVRSILAMFALTHQLGFFNILPLYIVLLLMTPAFFALARIDRRWMLLGSFALYVATRYFALAPPTWPTDAGWFFNPLAWQAVFVLGLFVGLPLPAAGPVLDRRLFVLSIAILIASLFLLTNGFGFLPYLWDSIRDRVAHDKTGLSWIRLVHFTALAYAVYYSGLTGLLRTTKIFAPLALLGRHSLAVFSAGALLTLVGEAILEAGIPDVPAQIITLAGGVLVQYLVALWFEARATRKRAAADAAAPLPERQAPALTPAATPHLEPARDGASLAT